VTTFKGSAKNIFLGLAAMLRYWLNGNC